MNRDGALVEQYQYDEVGTRTYEMNALRGITGRSMTYSAEDHLLTAGDVTYVYDVDGFLTTRIRGVETTTYNYSTRGELLAVGLANGTAIEYDHDPLGRRVAKKVNGVITEKYLWSGLTQLLAAYDGADNLVMRFEYADARMPVAMTSGGASYYLAYDQVGSLRVVADSAGVVVKEIEYDSFGNVIVDTNPAFTMPFGFAGGLHDRDTGLVRFGYRDYDPDIGRWTAKDPIMFAGGDSDLFGYVQNNPVNFVDPSGEIIANLVTAGIGGTAGAFSGLMNGIKSGSVAAGIAGGVTGGIVGAGFGFVGMPYAGGTAGGAAGAAVAGLIAGKTDTLAVDALFGATTGLINAIPGVGMSSLARSAVGAESGLLATSAPAIAQKSIQMSTGALLNVGSSMLKSSYFPSCGK